MLVTYHKIAKRAAV